jgi:hypothetical protein
VTGHDLVEQLRALGEDALGQEVQLDTPVGLFVATATNYDEDEPETIYVEGEWE